MYNLLFREDPYWFWSPKVKVKGEDCLQISFWLQSESMNYFQIYLIITHHLEKTPVDFGVKRSKVKVTCR